MQDQHGVGKVVKYCIILLFLVLARFLLKKQLDFFSVKIVALAFN